MRERLETLHQVGVVGLPFDDGLQVALDLEHVAADSELGAALLGENALDQRLACGANRARLRRVEHAGAHHETLLCEVVLFPCVEPPRPGH